MSQETLRKLERYRLFEQAAESDLLRKKHYVEPMYYRLQHLKRTAEPQTEYEFEFHVIYDNRTERKEPHKKEHSQPLFEYIEYTLQQFYGCKVERTHPIQTDGYIEPEVLDVTVTISLKGSETKKLDDVFRVVTSSIHYHHSDQPVMIWRNKKTGLYDLVFAGSGKYYRWVVGEKPKETLPIEKLPIEKIPFSSRTTLKNAEDMDLIKKLVGEYFHATAAEVVLRKDFGGALVAYEKITPEGKESHQAWRMTYSDDEILREYFGEIDSSQEMRESLDRLIERHNAFSFYPAVKRFGVRHKLVREYDRPPLMPMNLAAEISDIIHKTTNDLGIPSLYAFSGSNSARDQTFIDVEDLMQNADRIAAKYPVIGAVSSEKISSTVDLYNRIIRALELCVDMEIAEELHLRNKLWMPMRTVWQKNVANEWEAIALKAPTVTFSRNSRTRPFSLLDDTASTCSIGIGSVKAYLPLTDEKRKTIYNLTNDPHFKNPDLRYTLLACVPIESTPCSEEEKWAVCNVYSAAERLNAPGKTLAQMDKKITSEVVETVFARTIGDWKQRERIIDFKRSRGQKELEYLNRYYS